ncbi:hypothetical protein [Adlercreutzia sp. ZJ138]|uniref:hypothetical protein n=1 Tax=Adlercreutzia sp. ZJ138 TaxID=2709405 RepID=UPI0013EB7F9A|nr:hypothetical protein [Adlercreutzia sp. ZJ138]
MISRTPLANKGLVLVLCRTHAQLDSLCRSACDIGLESCAVLADITEHSDGLAVKNAQRRHRATGDISHFEHVLRERELVSLVRYAHDRRALAYVATSKGTERLALADHLMGQRLVSANSGLTEESVDKLVDLFYGYAEACGDHPVDGCLFPSAVLRALAAYRQAVMVAAARFGMTSANVSLLAMMSDWRSVASEQSFAWHTMRENGVEVAFDAQVAFLQERGLVEDDELRLTEAGKQRMTAFMHRLLTLLAPQVEDASPQEFAALIELLQYVLYLFAW